MARTRSAVRTRRFAPFAVMALMIGLLPIVATTAAAPAAAATFAALKIQVENARSLGLGRGPHPIPAGRGVHVAHHLRRPRQPEPADQPVPAARRPPTPTRATGRRCARRPERCRSSPRARRPTSGPPRLTGLAAGNYLISVLADGLHARRRALHHAAADRGLDVPVQPNPVPLGTIRIRVFHDNAPVDGTYEAGSETGARAASRASPASRRTCPTCSAR